MKHSIVMLLLLPAFAAHGAETKIVGAAYFVIHTAQKSVMYRAGSETIFCAPDFYKMRISKSMQDTCQRDLGDAKALITFHDKDTAMIHALEDDNPSEKMTLWRAMLDRAAKVYVYKAYVFPTRNVLRLHDRRDHLIIDLNDITYCENNSLEQYKELIRGFADPSLLNSKQSFWDGERIGKYDKIILSYKDSPLIAESRIENQYQASPLAINSQPKSLSEKNDELLKKIDDPGASCVIL